MSFQLPDLREILGLGGMGRLKLHLPLLLPPNHVQPYHHLQIKSWVQDTGSHCLHMAGAAMDLCTVRRVEHAKLPLKAQPSFLTPPYSAVPFGGAASSEQCGHPWQAFAATDSRDSEGRCPP